MTAMTVPAYGDRVRTETGAAAGVPKLMLRLEGGVVLAVAATAYAQVGMGWLVFGLLFLVPDLSMLGYLGGRRLGAVAYNLGHSYLLPILLAAYGAGAAQPVALSAGLIWIAHIGFDRLLGYGLKYGTAFGDTHLGRVGKRA